MKTLLRFLLIGLLLLVLTGGLLFANVWHYKPLSINWFYGRVFMKFALEQPEILTSLRVLDQFGIHGHNARLSDRSPEAAQRSLERMRDEYRTFQRYKRSAYKGDALLSWDVFDQFMADQLEGLEHWRLHDFPVNQLFGAQSTLPDFMLQQHVVENERGARHYIARLNEFTNYFEGLIEGLELRRQHGVLPPNFAITKVIAQVEAFLEGPPDAHLLVRHLDEKLAAIDSLKSAERNELHRQTVAAVRDHVYPAYGRLLTWLHEVEPEASSNEGVWRLPEGNAYYAYQVRHHTTTELTPEQIHRIGLAEVARIGAEMESILQDQGLTEGSLGERIQKLSERPDQLYEDSDEGRRQILADYQAILDEIAPAMDQYFNLRPTTGVEVRRIPEFSEENSAGAYYQAPSLDGKRGGVFYANLRDVSEVPRLSMRTLAYHEGIPGHHFQIAITQQLDGLPMFRRMLPFTAYIEGWALYAEKLASEVGFQEDPLDDLGRLQGEMFRAVRLVVDTGMHYKRWSREQAIDYMLEQTGMGALEVEAEIERYLIMPGQALAYKMGMMKILELRERAMEALGEDFDLREFHDQILGHGALPLMLLEQVVDQWLAEAQRS